MPILYKKVPKIILRVHTNLGETHRNKKIINLRYINHNKILIS